MLTMNSRISLAVVAFVMLLAAGERWFA